MTNQIEETKPFMPPAVPVGKLVEQKLHKASAQFSLYPALNYTGSIWSPQEVDKLELMDKDEYDKVVEQCRFYYRYDPIAGIVIDKSVDIGLSELLLDKNNLKPNEFRIFQGIQRPIKKFLESCALEYLISGLVIPEITYTAVNKKELEEMNIKKYSTLTLPTGMWLRNAKTVKINTTMIADKPSYYVLLPEELIYFIKNKGIYEDGTKDPKLYEYLKTYYPDFISQVENGTKEILLDNENIVRRKVLSDSPYPTVFLSKALEALKHKRNLRRMDYSIASRVISAIMLVRLGSDVFPITEDDEEAFTDIREQLTWRGTNSKNIERIFQLFTNHTTQIDWVFPPTEALLNEKKYAEVNEDIFFGLGFPRILTTGETQRTGSSNPEFATMSPVKSMEAMQDDLLPIAKAIINETAELNNLDNVPGVRFAPINMHAFADFIQGMKALYDTGNISRTSYTDSFGYNWEDEMKQKELEQEIIKDSDLPEFAPQPFSPQPQKPGQPAKPVQPKPAPAKPVKTAEEE